MNLCVPSYKSAVPGCQENEKGYFQGPLMQLKRTGLISNQLRRKQPSCLVPAAAFISPRLYNVRPFKIQPIKHPVDPPFRAIAVSDTSSSPVDGPQVRRLPRVTSHP